MQYTTLGRTGVRVRVAGLGCGGFSLLGLGSGKTAAEAVSLVRLALDMGVTLFDTAAAYAHRGNRRRGNQVGAARAGGACDEGADPKR